MNKNIVIVGGGNSAHVLIPLLSKTDFDISVLTSSPDDWSHTVALEYQNTDGEVLQVFKGKTETITNNPQSCIPSADYIVLCMPVHKYREALHCRVFAKRGRSDVPRSS
ncbi:MAG: NAD(P)-binding domain-containing protein [Bacteroidales bacterium]|nr:NAD(P)-binding domain-containing protein [Bacteroidales bacterium]